MTPVQAQAAARAAVRADAAYIVVVGDATALAKTLAPIAPLTIVDVDGKPVAAADLEVRAGGPAIDASKLVAASDSFTVLVQGQVFGFQASSLTRGADGWTYTERSQLATIIQQTTTVTFGADLTMRRTEQTGRLQGQEMGVRITYAGGKASGEGNVPGAQGMEPVRFTDVTVPAGVVDENVASVFLPYLAWGPDARHTINVLTSKGSCSRGPTR